MALSKSKCSQLFLPKTWPKVLIILGNRVGEGCHSGCLKVSVILA